MRPYVLSILLFLFFTSPLSRAAAPAKKESPAQIAAKKNFETAKAAAAKGDAVKLRELADLYYAGKGVSRDYAEAYKAYLDSAGKGDPLSVSHHPSYGGFRQDVSLSGRIQISFISLCVIAAHTFTGIIKICQFG
jgi:hypothetical protein